MQIIRVKLIVSADVQVVLYVKFLKQLARGDSHNHIGDHLSIRMLVKSFV